MTNQSNILTWLHISDFHIKDGDPYDRDVVLNALVQHVENERKRNGWNPDLIFATGDIANSGQNSQYERATVFFDKLLGAAGSDKSKLFVIPGNHDVDRSEGQDLKRTLDNVQESHDFFGSPKRVGRYAEKLGAFSDWYNAYFAGIRELNKTTSCQIPHLISVNDLEISVAEINTAFFCLDDHDHNKLWIGRRCLDPVAQTIKQSSADVRVALIHHPLSWLNDGEQGNISALLRDNFDVILNGHLHETDPENVAGAKGNSLHLAAGASYQGSQWPNKAMWVRAEVKLDQVIVHPIRYEDNPRPVWTIDPSLFPQEFPYEGIFSVKWKCGKGIYNSTPMASGNITLAPVALSIPEEPLSTTGVTKIFDIGVGENHFFTGREDVLLQLRTSLTSGNNAALTQAISGLGGIGKTRTAVEYASRYQKEYQYVFWVTTDTLDNLFAGYTNIAKLLNLTIKDEANQSVTTRVVKNWLQENQDWLLILDNADDILLIRDYLPSRDAGHTILTSRAPTFGGFAEPIIINKFSSYHGATLLLRRAHIIDVGAELDVANSEDQSAAIAISDAVDGLPLALDQAGAYIEESQCSVTEYLNLYREAGTELRALRGDFGERDHVSVTTTFSLAFEKVKIESTASADLLRLCAFFASDGISEFLLSDVIGELDNELSSIAIKFKLLQIIKGASRYSLLQRDTHSHCLTMHRVVQDVLKDIMLNDEKRFWSERVINAISNVAPRPEFANWPLWETLLPHCLKSIDAINLYNFEISSAADLLGKTGHYLVARGRYAEAELYLVQSLALFENLGESGNLNIARSLSDLGELYICQGRYTETRPLFERALIIREAKLGRNHAETAYSLNSLALCFYYLWLNLDAETLFVEALTIREKILGVNHADTATSLNNLASLYRRQGHYTNAEQLFIRAVEIQRCTSGPNHPRTATALENLAQLYHATGKYWEAEPLVQSALAIKKHALGAMHPETAGSIGILATNYQFQGRYLDAKELFNQVLTIQEETLGHNHPETAVSVSNLGLLYYEEGRISEALPLFERALSVRQIALGEFHLDTAISLNNLALAYHSQQRYTEAEPLLHQALTLQEALLKFDHPYIAITLNNTGLLFKAEKKYSEAENMYNRALAIQENIFRSDHPDIANTLSNMGTMFEFLTRYAEAEPVLERALTIRKSMLGINHPDTAESLNNLASLYESQGRRKLAMNLYEQSIAILKHAFGNAHPNLATTLENYSVTLNRANMNYKAGQILNQAKAVRKRHAKINSKAR